MNSMILEKDTKLVIKDLTELKEEFCVSIPNGILYHYDVVKGVRAKKYHPDEIPFSYKLMAETAKHIGFLMKRLSYDMTIMIFDIFAFVVGFTYWIVTWHNVYAMFGSETIQWIRNWRDTFDRNMKKIIFASSNRAIKNAKMVACPKCNKGLLDFNLVSLTGWCYPCSEKEFKPK